MWKPVVGGVDTSPEATRAAAVAWTIAYAADTACHFVHAVPSAWAGAAAAGLPVDPDAVAGAARRHARVGLEQALRGNVPDAALAQLEVEIGRAPAVLADALARHGAGLLVLGGKHHSALARWLGGTTAHHVIRTVAIPTLVTGSSAVNIRRVLAAVDLSYAAGPTIEVATRFARLFKAELCLVHVIEPMPVLPDVPVPADAEVAARSADLLEQHVWPMVDYPDTERVLRHGPAAQTVAAQATEWRADLLVVGSHGKGWVDRLLLGSTTNWLLNHLPTSLLVVPVTRPQGGATWLAKSSAG